METLQSGTTATKTAAENLKIAATAIQIAGLVLSLGAAVISSNPGAIIATGKAPEKHWRRLYWLQNKACIKSLKKLIQGRKTAALSTTVPQTGRLRSYQTDIYPMPNKLDQLKAMSIVVADTGDIQAMQKYRPVDATTNPSLLLKAAELPQYHSLLEKAASAGKQFTGSNEEQLAHAATVLYIKIGTEILKLIPGKVSTEVDARLSFDTRATVAQARKLVLLYEEEDIGRDRLLIKIASTWEGLNAAGILQKEGINCNLTLLFSFEQAAMAADVGAFLISPFVGRILDWYKKNTGKESYPATEDPGVLSVTQIYNYYKQHHFSTAVMGASFRNAREIEQLAGCDRLTISPQFLEELSNDPGKLERKLSPDHITECMDRPCLPEPVFRSRMNDNMMATEKLAEGIRLFIIDQKKLEDKLRSIRH
jgi:transaldolase